VIVFYSWQSDSPNASNRSFIKKAAERAIGLLAADAELESAARDDSDIVLDQDTQGVPGNPGIADTILAKIDACDVFLADVTLVAETPMGKKLINSNVALELGYAFGKHTSRVSILVMNTAFGQPKELPFDLAHRRHPIIYHLPDTHDQEARATALEELAKQLASALKVHAARSRGGAPLVAFQRQESVATPARYWPQEEKLIPPSHDGQGGARVADEARMFYLRVWPDRPLPLLSNVEAHDLVPRRALDGDEFVTARRVNRYGAIAAAVDDATGQIYTATQLFKCREMWTFAASLYSDEYDGRPRMIHTGALEKQLSLALVTLTRHARTKLNYDDPIHLEFGAVGLEGFSLAMPENYHFDKYWGPVVEDSFSVQISMTEDTVAERKRVMQTFMDRLFDAAGRQRPPKLSEPYSHILE
jgi:hypothetical protein